MIFNFKALVADVGFRGRLLAEDAELHRLSVRVLVGPVADEIHAVLTVEIGF